MKKVLIVSPHFPPVNAADMHRVRQSLPYFEKYGWKPSVLCVDPDFVEMSKDELLEESLPEGIEIFKVKAYSTKYTRKLGLGNLGIRAFTQLLEKGNELLKDGSFDLVYFSTTVFASMPLGRIWKKKFKLPFVIDMQDPWRNDYYLSVSKDERPPKFWFAYRLDKYLEAYTMPYVDGLISVSKGYIDTLKSRYPKISNIPSTVLTFGAATEDFEFVRTRHFEPLLDETKINIVYIGRGGHDMQDSLNLIFKSFKNGLLQNEKFKLCKFWFIGTSYAPDGQGEQTIKPLAEALGIGDFVEEITDRKPYFSALSILQKSSVILIPGSNDKNYTASKLYPNILAKRPLLCVFHSNSSVVRIVKELNAGEVVLFDEDKAEQKCISAFNYLMETRPFIPDTNWEKFEPFTAETMTKQQVDFFNTIIN